MPGGRPEDYNDQFPEQARKLCLLGATDKDLADFFEVTETTINNWKIAHPEFFESIKRGKRIADSEVAEKLYKRATGYSHPEVDIKVIDSQIVQTPLTKHYPPDTAAAIFWLKNRSKKNWRDKIETGFTDGEGNDVSPVQIIQLPSNGRDKSEDKKETEDKPE
jgi:hypothetical protein